jgi:RimJ/RimL family protein N-acetyltransferase
MSQIYLNEASILDLEFYNALRNDANNANPLNWSHWAPESLEKTESYILEHTGKLFTFQLVDETKIGYVKLSKRFARGSAYEECEEIGIFLCEGFRGRGFAPKMLLLAEAAYCHQQGLLATVDSRNLASINSFNRAGYRLVGQIPVIDSVSKEPCEIFYLVKLNDCYCS